MANGATLRGVLEIDLKPGWKTYWVSPGPVGLAPRIDFSASEGIASPQLVYPAPTRFREGEIESLGYTEPVGFAIEASPQAGARPILRASLLIGLCRDICVPVQLQLEAEPDASLGTRAAVRRAFDALPIESESGAGWKADLSSDEKRLVIEGAPAALDRARDLFVAAPESWAFGPPEFDRDGGQAVANVPVLAAPASAPRLDRVDLVLTDGEKSELIRALPVGRNGPTQ
ncbi:protein-disulfide reductase DsbD domain-containing protein [Aureimonas ureilytica]|uniref:protein-disulfide reductase DsbD domain-containing protein n=1 Tax=Aureimonas ureilytica TaxID=401562 RepID=UPI000367BCA9|nr:protein-disulfide reductase DsbD domain-containing protein [Aureimonas ureilytica]